MGSSKKRRTIHRLTVKLEETISRMQAEATVSALWEAGCRALNARVKKAMPVLSLCEDALAHLSLYDDNGAAAYQEDQEARIKKALAALATVEDIRGERWGLSVQEVKDALLGNSHPMEGAYAVFYTEEEFSNAVAQIVRKALIPKGE